MGDRPTSDASPCATDMAAYQDFQGHTKVYSLLLVIPRQKFKHYSMQIGMAQMAGKANTMPSLALALIAALTPRNYTITIADEEVDGVPYDRSFDIVGITAFSNTIDRAYAIADTFRKKGAMVVMGGAHVTFAADETLEHADAVVLGEAEEAWPRLLRDFENGTLKPRYQSQAPAPFVTSPFPRWDLVRTGRYLSLPIQASRGCPYNCEFCLVTKMFGKKKRMRDLDDIVAEIESLPSKRIFFVDDNLTINKNFAHRLMARLKPLEVSWVCQSSIDVTDDEQLLLEMAEAGCHQILIGFESLNQANLDETHKDQNDVSKFEQAIGRIHKVGIHVLASFIIGFDQDTVTTFDTIHEFCLRNHVPYMILNVLACSPGSDLYRKMEAAGRLCRVPAEYKDGMFPTIEYVGLKRPELFRGYLRTLRREFAYDVILAKAKGLFSQGTFTRQRKDPELKPYQKGLIFFRLIGIFLFSADKNKRETFLYLFRMFRRGGVAIESVVMYLMSMEGFNRYVKWLSSQEGTIVAAIERFESLPPSAPISSDGMV